MAKTCFNCLNYYQGVASFGKIDYVMHRCRIARKHKDQILMPPTVCQYHESDRTHVGVPPRSGLQDSDS